MSLTPTEKLEKYLCAPGNGVFTVQTAKEKKEVLHRALYGVIGDDATTAWQKKLQEYCYYKVDKPYLFGICHDTGGGILRGANWGPLFVRQSLYEKKSDDEILYDIGDVRVIPHLLMDKYLNSATVRSCRNALYGNEHLELAVSPLSIAQEIVSNVYALNEGARFFAIGGDHSISYPLTKAYINHQQSLGKKVGIIHYDAHTDLLQQRLGIDICFGSWTYHILNDLERPNHVVQIGIRSSGKPKEYWEEKYGVKQYWNYDVKNRGIEAIAEETIAHFKEQGIDEIYLTFDIDALDAKYASATGTPESEGLTLEDALTSINMFAEQLNITSGDLAEVAPFVSAKHSGADADEPATTLHSAGEISKAIVAAMQFNKK
ncbi:MAG: arginase family protein [Aestuariibacter sp.]